MGGVCRGWEEEKERGNEVEEGAKEGGGVVV